MTVSESESTGSAGVWPRQVCELASRLEREKRSEEHSSCARAELWRLLGLALAASIRMEMKSLGRLEDEDVVDIAAEKCIDLMRRIDEGAWRPQSLHPHRVRAYVRSVARNGLVDVLRRRGRIRMRPLEGADEELGDAMTPGTYRSHRAFDDRAERDEFVDAVLDCVSEWSPRDRRVWMMRVFFEMPSRMIGAHPAVGTRPANVDVILQRCRARLRAWMTRRGHDITSVPTGTFAALWERFEREAMPWPDASDEPGGRP